MIIGFVVSGPDNGSVGVLKQQASWTCPVCGLPKNKLDHVDPELRVKRRNLDLSFTFDNLPVVSRKLKECCLRARLSGIDFVELESDPDFFILNPTGQFVFDTVARKTRFLNRCDACGQHESVVGALPAFLKDVPGPIADGVFRTDVEFGSGVERGPLLIVGARTRERFERENLVGLEYSPIHLSHESCT